MLWITPVIAIVAAACAGLALGTLDAELFPTEVRGTSSGFLLVSAVAGSAVGLVLATQLKDLVGGLGPGHRPVRDRVADRRGVRGAAAARDGGTPPRRRQPVGAVSGHVPEHCATWYVKNVVIAPGYVRNESDVYTLARSAGVAR